MATNGNNYGLFWKSVDQDRVYGADSFEMLFKRFFTTGVFLNDFQTTATTGMFVQVGGSDDYANIEGKVYKTVATHELSLPAAHSTYPRIDTVVLARDNQARKFTISIVKGSYSGQNPVPTAPIRSATRYELVLAQIYVKAGATAITQADITDTRANKDLCGIVACAVEEYDFEQWSAKFNADFADWFNNVKDNLSEDAAGHLQNEIDSLVESLTASAIAYSNTTSGLTATKVQGAIDEVNNKVNNANTEIANVKTEITNVKTRVTNIENQLTDNGETIFVQKRNGKWGYNTSSNRGADTFTPFRKIADGGMVIELSGMGHSGGDGYENCNGGGSGSMKLKKPLSNGFTKVTILAFQVHNSNISSSTMYGQYTFQVNGISYTPSVGQVINITTDDDIYFVGHAYRNSPIVQGGLDAGATMTIALE